MLQLKKVESTLIHGCVNAIMFLSELELSRQTVNPLQKTAIQLFSKQISV